MSTTPCTTCLTVDCVDVPDLTRYNFQLNSFISPQYTFIVSCPVGENCLPGTFPVTVVIPPGTFVIITPDPTQPITGVGPLTVTCCAGTFTSPIPDGSSVAQIQALAAALAQKAAAAQAQCNALKSPGGHIPPVQPNLFYNGVQCVPTLTCTAPDVFTVTGSIPTGYQLDVDNNLCIVGGMVSSSISQADADSKALALVTTEAAALVSNGTLACKAAFNWNNMVWSAPNINTTGGGTASGTSVGNSINGAVSCPAAGSGNISYQGSMTYKGPAVSCNLHVVVSSYSETDTGPGNPILVVALDDGFSVFFTQNIDSLGTFDFPFTVPDTGGATHTIETNQFLLQANSFLFLGGNMTAACTLTPAL